MPVQADYLAAEDMTELLGTVQSIKRQINPRLKIGGVFLTMANETNFRRDTVAAVKENFGKYLPVLHTVIPATVRLAEISTADKSIFLHEPRGRAAEAYRGLVKEVLEIGEKQRGQTSDLSVDSLFTTQAERDEAQRETVRDIPIEEISDFPNHPFKVRMDESMMEMADSVKQYGVLVPGLVRPKPDVGYEMVAGHRRKMASELAGKAALPCIVRDLTDEEATIIMVDSNLQREQILPSEKAFAYKMKLDAMRRQQGSRTDLTSATPLQKLDKRSTRELLAEQAGESHEQIRKYIRLTHLIPGIAGFGGQLCSQGKRGFTDCPAPCRGAVLSFRNRTAGSARNHGERGLHSIPCSGDQNAPVLSGGQTGYPMCCYPSCRRKNLIRLNNSRYPRSVFQSSSRRGRPRRKWRIPS